MTPVRYIRVAVLATALTVDSLLPTPTYAMPPCSLPNRVHVEAHKVLTPTGHPRLLATISVAAPDSINSITFGQMHNASVTAAAYDSATTRIRLVSESPTSGQTVIFPAGTTTVQLLVERTVEGGGVFVPFTVHDSCGAWPSFVGGGLASF
jgi:hypothetical protein